MKRTKVTMDKETILFSFKNDNDLQRFLDKLHIIIPKEKVFEGMNTLIVSVDDYKFCMEHFALCSIGTPNFMVV